MIFRDSVYPRSAGFFFLLRTGYLVSFRSTVNFHYGHSRILLSAYIREVYYFRAVVLRGNATTLTSFHSCPPPSVSYNMIQAAAGQGLQSIIGNRLTFASQTGGEIWN